MDQMQLRSQGSLLPALLPSRSVGRVGENSGNEVGPNEDLWGQPHDLLDHSLLIVPSFTRLYLSFRNDRIRSTDWLVNLYALSFLMTKLWHRESKALLMSVDRIVTKSFLSIACFQSSISLTSVVSPLWFFLYAVNLEDRVQGQNNALLVC